MKKLLSILSLGFLGIFMPAVARAQVALLPDCATGAGDCTTCDMMVLFLNFAELLTIWISAAVLVAFVWGGVLWIISGGNSERVNRGKQVMIGAVIGLFLVGGGYTIVNFSIGALVGADDLNAVQLFGTDWNTFCEGGSFSSTNTGGSTGQQSADDAPADVVDESSDLGDAPVDDCADADDGQACNTDGCGEACRCYSGACFDGCQIAGPLKGAEYFSGCKVSSEECQAEADADDSFSLDSTVSGICAADAPVCCIYKNE